MERRELEAQGWDEDEHRVGSPAQAQVTGISDCLLKLNNKVASA